MALESFLLHFRNLRAFLCPSLQKLGKDDILASDFLDKSEAKDLGDGTKLAKDVRRLNEMLAHLSYERQRHIAAGDYRWNVGAMLVTMLEELQQFFYRLSKDGRVDWFPCASELANNLKAARLVAAP